MRRGHSCFFSKTAGYFLLFCMLLLPNSQANASVDVTDESDSRSMFVRVEENSVQSNSPPAPRDNAPSRRSSSRGASPGQNASQSNGQVASEAPSRARCRNRSEIFSALALGRECDPTIEPEVTTTAPLQDPVPVVNNNQPEVVQEEPVEIVITASDLLELIPASPQILMDEGPFGLKNAHTNFYASNHRPQTVTETMFGQEVTITATPIEYRWEYGDGNSLVTDVPGHPVDVFNTETETSHQYEDTGLYTVQLTTVFEGTYQVDGGETQMVSSTVTQQADPVEIRIWRAVTRNVDQTCQQNSQAWGC